MFAITKRLDQVQQATNPREHKEKNHVEAGRSAEYSFVSSLRRRSGLDGASIFCGLRVPDEYQSRKREIDVVVLTTGGIICIEVKNWGGCIKPSDDNHSWLQTKNKRLSQNAYVSNFVEHENGISTIKLKGKLLRDHLMRNGVSIREKLFKTFVVFVNQNCEVDAKIANDPCVVVSEKCDAFIGSFQKGYLEWLQESVTPSLLSGLMSSSQLSCSRAVLSSIGTWDIIELNGGKRLYGDYKDCPGIALDRAKTEALEITHLRSYALGLAFAAMGYTPSVTVSALERGGSGWVWNSYGAVVKIPYNTEIVFRICGDEIDSKIPVNDVLRVTISI
ncbi:predicted protein [Nematostella vectensis]|uniref:NERD domain-containing protein n=1 Tax=Nematostella vectensis TaxID=45351 RepID=A7S8D6_NEMVE|nr:uncharacterized protein LOC5511739 [Nematostella vectensis]EDO40048.1 predicted protein [Nematostella vectensis]|eukprot:XP_001632111.1 predicted protein [Nematostella vectensis]